ncbi:MAG TPA: hypothetical protein EYN66_22075, partial [Myxococcales bacterium]|nr:hypothetical protein [Myxococcales bacterium]
MKRWLAPLLLTIALAIAVPYLTSLSNDHGGYRLSGVQLMDQAGATSAQRAHSSALPLPSLVARWGINTFTEWPKFETVAFLNSIAIGVAIGVVGMATAQLGGFTAGFVAVLLMLSFPGSLFHGRVVGPEAITMLAFALLLWAGTRGAKTVQGALFGTLALLAAMASHHEAAIIALPWLAAAVLTAQKGPKALSPAALIPLLAAPLVLSALWPFLQSGGSSAWAQAFITPHIEPHAPIIVLGEIRNQALASAPTFLDGLLLILLRVPVVTAVLALLGATCIVRACNRGQLPWQRYFVPLSCLSLIGVQSLNGSPYYDGSDGTIRWLPALAMMGGIGASRF